MSNDLEIHFKNVVERIFSNWTGIQLAVEHGMTGSMGKQIVLQAIDYVCNYCLTTDNIQPGDITEELEDMLDEEFNTICEDNSPHDVAHELFKFIQILKHGNMEMFITESNKLPALKTWFLQPQLVQAAENQSSDDENSNDEAEDESMDVDPGWTVVKGKRKK